MEKKLTVNNLKISFRTPAGKVQAVRNISFDLYKGETLAIVGESGSGKSVTNKAIIGISSGNAIVESGEIIYDGQDLLKITEEDFHKIRGDKIAMIFQDPMSSLNPIMRVGKQLTEAMILKNKASKRNARRDFNSILKLLNENMNELASSEEQVAKNNESCKTFDNFCINSTKLETVYNDIIAAAQDLKDTLENILFLYSKHQPLNTAKVYSAIGDAFKVIVHPSFIKEDEKYVEILSLYEQAKSYSSKAAATLEEVEHQCFEQLLALINETLAKEPINYFTLGYYTMFEGEDSVFDMEPSALNHMTRKYLDENFMLEFINNGSYALENSHKVSIQKKKALIEVLNSVEQYFKTPNFDKATVKEYLEPLYKQVEDAIDRLEIIKNGVEYTFVSSVNNVLDKYFFGIKNNPKEIARFEKQTAKREALIERGKSVDWKVVPASLIDLQLICNDICNVIRKLRENYEAQILNSSDYDKNAKMVALVDFFKEKASAVVYTVTRKIAKHKALKLLEEVGIPEPAIRYRQYPFEFSGGMRQRIVIAIALAANPDILICDEPTTALDVTIQSQILELINKLKVERNLSVIFITHDLGVVANMADRIAVMYAGKIVEYGTADDVFYDPRHPYTWALLSSMPDLDTAEKLEAIPGTPPNMIFPPKGDAFAARNRYALQIDFEEEPPLFEVTPGHLAATWLLHPSAPQVEAPRIVTERIAKMKKRMEEEENE